ncbi:hypothetical protein Pan216_34890 [Planctomycetes bacterium Pan216]|uniref:HD domain-containing protein n=1 Tax=Kolteria novifilia TaxID=2527975 RepID=A0A518B6Q3_9BACT|nr:hypothetical protein Pan216_34890 [Planctomycetes bacterium Pan216]
MPQRKLREQIAHEAARLLFEHQEQEYDRAKRKAARLIGMRFRHRDMPTNREIRGQLDRLEFVFASNGVERDPRKRKLAAVRVMRSLIPFSPRFIADEDEPSISPRVVASHDNLPDVLAFLENNGLTVWLSPSSTEEEFASRGQVAIDVDGTVPVEVTLVPSSRTAEDVAPYGAETKSLWEVESALEEEFPESDLDQELAGIEPHPDRFEAMAQLLEPLEDVRQEPVTHPEGDALYHSLQVFTLGLAERPDDEELLTAALMHDVGKAIDLKEHVEQTLALLEGLVTHRTLWLIEHLPDARLYGSRELPTSRRRLLERSEEFEDVLLLAHWDKDGRRRGAEVKTPNAALDHLRSLDDATYWEYAERDECTGPTSL